MRSIFKTTLRLSVAITIVLCAFSSAYAADYTPLVSLPGVQKCATGPGCEETTLEKYIPAMFKLTIAVAAGMAFVVLTFGGVTYATSDALTGKQDGRRWITNALGGLLLVIGAYAILWTVNPQILSFKLSIPSAKVKEGTPLEVGTGTPLTSPAQVQQDNEVLGYLGSAPNSVVTNAPPCTPEKTKGCTNVIGLPKPTQDALKALEGKCHCGLVITGGTEGGHQTHAVGQPIVDLRASPGLNKYLTGSTATPANDTSKNLVGTNGPDGRTARFKFESELKNDKGEIIRGEHWHVYFNMP